MIVNNALCKVYNQSTIKDHAKSKSMWMGSFEQSISNQCVYDRVQDIFEKKDINYSPALINTFYEVLANSVDQYLKMKSHNKRSFKVTCIDIIFDKNNGNISIKNNGQGIPISVVLDSKNNKIYIPELISTRFLAGSNNTENKNRKSAGTNGLGLTLVNNLSECFKLTTTDLDTKKIYTQISENGMDTINTPIIKKYSQDHRGTTISFKPDYKKFKTNINNDFNTIESLIMTRIIYSKLYTNIKFTYNGTEIKCNHRDFARKMFPDNGFVITKIRNWNVIVGVSHLNQYQTNSIINGIEVNTGTHLDYIKGQIVDTIKSKAEKVIKKYKNYKNSMLTSCMYIIIIGEISNPQFVGQTKNKITNSKKEFSEYKITKSACNSIWKLIQDKLIDNFLSTNKSKKEKKTNTNGIKKYRKAKFANTQNAHKCKLLICEGDSAESMTRTCLTSPLIKMNYDYFGTFNIQGVPINSRTKTNIIRGKTQRTKQLIDNERLSSLQRVLNLDYDKKYESKEEISTLSYGCIIICVDQDLDGIGQIFGLILSHIELFWPSLIKNGFIKQLSTPIIRAYRNKIGTSFYTDQQYEKWSSNKDVSKYKICYYKGLATHNDKEAIEIFSNFDNLLCNILYDSNAKKSFNIYYGKEPDLRKIELKDGMENIEDSLTNRSCTDHLKIHTKAFQLDNIKRKLPCIFDGLNPARRKVLCGSIKKFTSSKIETKVFQLSGYIAELMSYHHGSASLEKTIINMAQDYIGANNIPLLLPLSQFGSRFAGGKDCGAPRYIKTTLNKKLVDVLFKREDDYVLDYNQDEGQINEPIYYVPVAPYVLLESLELPATGWKYAGYARKWNSIYTNIINLIDSEGDCKITKLPFWCNKWTGKIKDRHFIGRYSANTSDNTITILELPYRVWNEKYVDNLKKNKDIDSINDYSSKTDIKIVIKFKKNKFPTEIDNYVAKKLGIYKKINRHLNFIGDNNTIIELDKYKQVLIIWYKKRHEIYIKRINRQLEITKLRIVCIKEIIRFVTNYSKYKFSTLDEDKAIELLKDDKYVTINKSILDNPSFINAKDMKKVIIDNGNYNYLLNINSRQRLNKYRINRKKRLNDLEKYYAKLSQKNSVKVIWKEELLAVNKVINNH